VYAKKSVDISRTGAYYAGMGKRAKEDFFPWPCKKNLSDHMAMRQAENRKICKTNRNENWMLEKLTETGRKWTRQARWGFRLFDFWNHDLGVAVEVDGPEHDQDRDAYIDAHFMKKSGILTIRVKNRDEAGARAAIEAISKAMSWNARRASLGLKPVNSTPPKKVRLAFAAQRAEARDLEAGFSNALHADA
jgi:very-short-patch-repair endonuclease